MSNNLQTARHRETIRSFFLAKLQRLERGVICKTRILAKGNHKRNIIHRSIENGQGARAHMSAHIIVSRALRNALALHVMHSKICSETPKRVFPSLDKEHLVKFCYLPNFKVKACLTLKPRNLHEQWEKWN